jgi:hypothetical protein
MTKQNPDMEKPNLDFIVGGLDVIISLAEGLGPGFESLISNSNLIGMIIPLAKVLLRSDKRVYKCQHFLKMFVSCH